MSGGVPFYDKGRTASKKQEQAHSKLNEDMYNPMPVAIFLCEHYNVSDVCYIDPFARQRVNAWEVMTPTMLAAEIETNVDFHVDPNQTNVDPEKQVKATNLASATLLTSPQPKNPFKHPNTQEPMQSDLSQVCIYSIACRRYSSDLPISVAPRLNYYPEAMSKLQNTQERDSIYKAAGAVRGAFTQFPPTNGEQKDLNDVPMPELSFAYQNRFFVQTWAQIDASNIRNGLVCIPPSVCEQAKLPLANVTKIEAPEGLILEQFKLMKIDPNQDPKQAQKVRGEVNERHRDDVMKLFPDAKPIEFYYAVPINHVLAWGYTSEDYMAERKHKAYQFRFSPPEGSHGGLLPVVMYFLVPNTLVEANIESALEHMVGKADKQDIQKVGFEILANPLPTEMPKIPSSCNGTLKMATYISYYSGPNISAATRANLAPTLCPGYPSCHEWSVEEQSKMAAIEQYQQETGKTVRGFKQKKIINK